MNKINEANIYRVKFTDYTHDGLAVAKINDFPIFVENGVVGCVCVCVCVCVHVRACAR